MKENIFYDQMHEFNQGMEVRTDNYQQYEKKSSRYDEN